MAQFQDHKYIRRDLKFLNLPRNFNWCSRGWLRCEGWIELCWPIKATWNQHANPRHNSSPQLSILPLFTFFLSFQTKHMRGIRHFKHSKPHVAGRKLRRGRFWRIRALNSFCQFPFPNIGAKNTYRSGFIVRSSPSPCFILFPKHYSMHLTTNWDSYHFFEVFMGDSRNTPMECRKQLSSIL